MSIFTILLGFMMLLVDGVQKAWTRGEQLVEVQQNGRATLEIISRELALAEVSPRLQMVQNPALNTVLPNFDTSSDSLFWVAPLYSTSRGNQCGVGYYLTRDPAKGQYRLNRFYVQPDNPDGYYLVGKNTAAPFSAAWVTALPAQAFDVSTSNTKRAASIVSDGVIAMWIQCFDLAGNPIPALSAESQYGAASPIKFNSAAAFRMAAPPDAFPSGKTFRYTAPPPANPGFPTGNPVPANRLPPTVEITLLMLDSRTLKGAPAIPARPAPGTDDVPTQIQKYKDLLAAAGIKKVTTFSTRTNLLNSTP